jgi:hypothetical protein
MSRRRLAVATLAWALALATQAGARDVVPWTAAGEHVDRLVTVEGVVARGYTTAEGRCILEFDAADPTALRIVLLIPLVTDLPREPQRLYQGKRVQVSGRVTRFQRRLEMAVTPNQIEVVGLTEAPPTPTPAPAPATPAAPKTPAPSAAPPAPAPTTTPRPPVAAPPAPAPRAPAAAPAPPPPPPPAAPVRVAPPPAPPPTTAPTTPPTTLPPDPQCRKLDDERSAIRAELRTQNEALQQCLAEGRSGCAALGDRLGPLLSRLEGVEQQLARRCP